MKKYIKILFAIILITFIFVIIKEVIENEQKKELVQNFCQNQKVDSKFNLNNTVNNVTTYGDDEMFYYTEHTAFGAFMCTVKLKNGVIINKTFN